MGFKQNYVNEINELLVRKRNDADESFTINIPEHKFKKHSEKFNWALRHVYETHLEEDVRMFHLILSLQEYFEVDWLIENVVNKANKAKIKEEMTTEYNMKQEKPKEKPNAKKRTPKSKG